MNFFNYNIQKPQKNINNNLFIKKNILPKSNYKSSNKNIYNNYIFQNNINNEKCIKPNLENYLSRYNLKSYGNIQQNNDIELLKIKMNFNLINQKMHNMESIIKTLNQSNNCVNISNYINNNDKNLNLNQRKNTINKIHLRDKMSKGNNNRNNQFIKKYNINNNYNNSVDKFENLNVFNTHHNYSVQNIRHKKNSNNLNNDSNIEKTNYNSYYSIQNEKAKTLNNQNYNSYNDLNQLYFNNDFNCIIQNKKSYTINNSDYTYSINNNHHIQNQKRTISKKININNNIYNNIRKIPNQINNKNHKNNQNIKFYQNIFNEKSNTLRNNSNLNFINEKSENFGKYFGSFDEFFLDNYTQTKMSNNINENINNEKIRVNIIHKKDKNKNNFNIYNIVKNDKIIQNNYFEYTNKNQTHSIKNSKLSIENQNSLSYLFKRDKEQIMNNNIIKTDINEEMTRNKFQLNNLQKCKATDLYIPNNTIKKNEIRIKMEQNNYFSIKEDKNLLKNDSNNNLKILKNNINKKKVICKDDFYYDLLTEKIIDVENVNNSFNELNNLQRIKIKFLEKFERRLSKDKLKNMDKKVKTKSKKTLRFCEENNKIIEMNQNDLVSKFKVFNHLGKKIYFKKCNMNNYIKILKNKKHQTKSILVNKKEIIDNSEWDNLYDIINQIVKKNNNGQNQININTKKTFKIKNIESFKKKGKKSVSKNKKIKK